MKSLGPQVGLEPRKVVRELVQNTILLEPAMAATAMALFLIRTGDAVTISALAEELTVEYLARLIRAERAAAVENQPDDTGTPRRQPFLPEYAEQLKQLPDVIPNRVGDQIQTRDARYLDLKHHLRQLNHEHWAKRTSDPKIVAATALLRTMHPHWKENPDITLEQVLVMESKRKLTISG